MMGLAEKRYNWIEDILVWCHGKYTREELEKMNMTQLGDVHAEMHLQILTEINIIVVKGVR